MQTRKSRNFAFNARSDWLPANMPNVPPQRRYRESSKVLGRGSFGVVRLARDTVSGDDVVVKRVAIEAGDLEEAREEVRVLRELHHPHICRVLDAWETPSALCIVMPFYAAGDLQHRLKGRSEGLPPDEVCSLAAQLLLALQEQQRLKEERRKATADKAQLQQQFDALLAAVTPRTRIAGSAAKYAEWYGFEGTLRGQQDFRAAMSRSTRCSR